MVPDTGSPPRAWGRRPRGHPCADGNRFTPTCVGKTTPTVGYCTWMPVHPHVRGEDSVSSPALSRLSRFTPTCVGKTDRPANLPPMPSVHPHVRGEDLTESRSCSCRFGSPPRAWGRRRVAGRGSWLLPVHPHVRGEDRRKAACIAVDTVHPHVRGEDETNGSIGLPASGSPPRAWGRRQHPPDVGCPGRFTPTCVGKTPSAATPPITAGSPPRAWGRRGLASRGPAGSGSPPRAWGDTCVQAVASPASRFTPTRVGKTQPPLQRFARPVHPHVRGED